MTVVVLDAEQLADWGPLLGTLRVAPREVGGVLVYRLRPARR